MIPIIVDTAVVVPVNVLPLTDDGDFKTRETSVAYDASGMDLVWNFVTPAGAVTQTAVTPTSGGVYDWAHAGDGMYTIEIPASGGASINNDTEGVGYFTGVATGVLPWRGPNILFGSANAVNSLLGLDRFEADVKELGSSTQSATDLKDFADSGYDPTNNEVNAHVTSYAKGMAPHAFATTIGSVTNQTTFVIADGPPNNDSVNTWQVLFIDSSDAHQVSARYVVDFATSGKILTIDSAPEFTIASGDTIVFYPFHTSVVPTVTNLTNAPTSGDLTATMKASVTTAATSATPNLNSAYDAAKTAAQASELAKVPKSDGSVSWNATALGDINAAADTALADAGVTTTRTGYMDNLNVGGNVASSAEVTAIQNNTKVVRNVPTVIKRPATGTQAYRIELLAYDSTGNMEAPDEAPTLDLVNQSGDDLTSRLDSTTGTLVSTGRYRWVYTADDEDTLEQLIWTFSVVEGGNTRVYGNTSVIVDTVAVDFTADDRTKLETLHSDWINGGRLDEILDARASQTSVDDVPNNTEFAARTLAAADYATAAAQTTAQNDLDILTGTDGATLATSQPNYAPAVVGDIPTAAQNRTEMDANSTKLALITSERMGALTDWIDGGRLDLILDGRASQTSVDAIWATALTEAYRSTGATGTAAQLLYEIVAHLGNAGIAGTTKTLKKLDKSTTAKTYTLDDATTPTAIEEAS